MATRDDVEKTGRRILGDWLMSCKRHGKFSRNTIAVGIVVLDKLRHQCPVSSHEILSEGGEIKGARSGLGNTLQIYGIPRSYLKEVTTRQGHQDGHRLLIQLKWGEVFVELSGEERDAVLDRLVQDLVIHAMQWLMRQNLRLELDRRQAPSAWVHLIMENAKNRSGGIVEQHLVGAMLEFLFKDSQIPNFPAHAADRQTAREGDFTVSRTVYHVTATPTTSVVQKCSLNIRAGMHPLLLVPQEQVYRARSLVEYEGADDLVSVFSIEDFVALNIIEMAAAEGKDFFILMKEIVQTYNRRLEEVETDLSLRIELR